MMTSCKGCPSIYSNNDQVCIINHPAISATSGIRLARANRLRFDISYHPQIIWCTMLTNREAGRDIAERQYRCLTTSDLQLG